MRRFVVALWLTFVTAISLMPLRLKNRVGTTGALHNPGHFLVFLITAILVCRHLPNPASRLLRWIGVFCFAVLMEILEAVIYHNRTEWHDVLVDVLGAATGLAVLSIFPVTSTQVQDSKV